MTWPTEYGGHGRRAEERFVVMEELLAAGAPVSAYWAGDRQVGPALLRNGTEDLKRRFLPRIAAGSDLFCLGLSEPDSGSDLASVRTRAAKQPDASWLVNGVKLWTSGAHLKDYMLTLCRTQPNSSRHEGLSQLIVDLRAPGVTVRPIYNASGDHHFNEVVLDEVKVPADMLLGVENGAWAQVTAELADERSGPERYMSTLPLIEQYARSDDGLVAERVDNVGSLASRLWALRALSRQVATAAGKGENLSILAAVAKDVGTTFEQDSIEQIQRSLRHQPRPGSDLQILLEKALNESPGFTIRGGTTQVLRSIISKRMGM
jgi:hypothetical protein